MSKDKAQKIAKSKAKHPAFNNLINGQQQAFDINTIIRYDLHTGLFSVNADIDSVDTIYDAKFGGWRTVGDDYERKTNMQVIETLARVCVMLNQMVESNGAANKENDTNE